MKSLQQTSPSAKQHQQSHKGTLMKIKLILQQLLIDRTFYGTSEEAGKTKQKHKILGSFG